MPGIARRPSELAPQARRRDRRRDRRARRAAGASSPPRWRRKAAARAPRASALAAPPPRATYRLQFHKDFTFDDAAAIVPYLARLGDQPRLRLADPQGAAGLDPRLRHRRPRARSTRSSAARTAFHRLSDALRAHGLGLVLDIVPNHMGVGGADNAWWLSVLEWGELSPYAQAFDIDWERLGANRKLVVPVPRRPLRRGARARAS